MAKRYSVVPLSPKTGKELKRVKKGQNVLYGIKGPRGGIKLLHKEPQKFFKTDLAGLTKLVEATKSNNFIVYEQKLRTIKKIKGEIQYRVDKDGKKHKLHETKITFAKPRARTKPLLYSGSKRIRDLDFGHKTGNYQKIKKMRDLTIIKPNTIVYNQVLKGKTLKDAISNIHIDVSMANVRKFGLGVFYNIFMIIHTPKGEIIKVPAIGSFKDSDTGERYFEQPNDIYIKKLQKTEQFGRNEIKILANLHSSMSKAMRYALKNAGNGYTFTSLRMLDNIADRQKKLSKKLEKAGKESEANRAINSIKGLFFGYGNRKKLFVNPNTKLTLLKGNHSVTLYVKFEMM